MTEPLTWEQADAAYLSAAVAWIHALLESHISEAHRTRWERLSGLGHESERPAGLAPTALLPDAKARASAAWHRSQTIAADLHSANLPPPSVLAFGKRFGLTDFERHVLVLCVAAELDTGIGWLCARVQADPQCPYPTFALALNLFDQPEWEALLPSRPLRAARLLEIHQAASTPLIAAALHLDERCLHYLKGVRRLDDRLEVFIDAAYTADTEPPQLPPTQVHVAVAAAHRLAAMHPQPLPLVRLEGTDRSGRWHVACRTVHDYAAQLGKELKKRYPLTLYRLPLERLPLAVAEVDELARLWRREARLFNFALYLDPHETAPAGEPEGAARATAAARFLDRAGCLTFVAAPAPLPTHRASLVLEVNHPTPPEQHHLWLDILGPNGHEVAGLLASQFSLGVPAIHQAAANVAAAGPSSATVVRQLWTECCKATRPRVDGLAQRIDVKATWADLVLPDRQLQQLRHLRAQVYYRWRVHEEWGARVWLNRGLGVSALFAGESGTGKTMAAEVLAADLSLDLYRIDLSAVIDKFVGETEKRLCRLFDAFEHCGAILFFDECDALFGKRTDVKDSHDRYANIEVSYLLQRLESYRGVTILATNNRGALDAAFLRRLRAVVTFPMPDEQQRRAIWERHLPPEPHAGRLPAKDLDYGWLARLELSGGNIQTVALNAAFFAAAHRRDAVTMPDILAALRDELRKLGRPPRLPPVPAAWEMEAVS